MYAQATSVYGLNFKARCLSALSAQTEYSQFLIGTQSLKDVNEIHVVEVKDDGTDLRVLNVLAHKHEIWDLAPSPIDTGLIFTSYSENNKRSTSLWKTDLEHNRLDLQVTLPTPNTKYAKWHPSGKSVAALDDYNLRVLSLDGGSDDIGEICAFDIEQQRLYHSKATVDHSASTQRTASGAWDPHSPTQFAVLQNSHVVSFDTNSGSVAWSLSSIHHQQVRDIDFNPNRRHIFSTAGDDGRISVWDVRSLNEPLTTTQAHNHWIWNLKYNPFHDQLLLSSSADNHVNLWDLSSLSSSAKSAKSEPIAHANENHNLKIVKDYDDHEDSVYGLAWSAAHPWVFASLSYSGRAVISVVPQNEQDKVLLSES